MNNQLESQAENIVSRWYSLTRNKHIEEKGVITLLVTLITHNLAKQGVDQEVAHQMALKAVTGWVEECDGLSMDNFIVFEVLEARILKILK